MTATEQTSRRRTGAADFTGGTFLAAGWYLTTAEAAAEIGVGYRTVWKAINEGHITARRIGRRHLIPAGEVVRYRDLRAAATPRAILADDAGRRGGSTAQSYPKGAPKAPRMVVYRHSDGSEHRINHDRARVLEALDSYNGIVARGELINRLFEGWDEAVSRRRIINHLDALHHFALIMRGEGRDRRGGPVATVWLTIRGADALRYCKERGLI